MVDADGTPPPIPARGSLPHEFESRELVSGSGVALRLFGRDLTAYRSPSGRTVVLDADRPDLAARLGHGGGVIREQEIDREMPPLIASDDAIPAMSRIG